MQLVAAFYVLSTTLAPHPWVIHNILGDLKFIEALIVALGDWGQHPRLLRVRHLGRSTMFRQCQALLHRCAELVDACYAHFCTNMRPLPAYEVMAEAVRACDDVYHFLVPTFQQFYREDLRRRLVACMEDSATATPDSVSESPQCTSHDTRHTTHVTAGLTHLPEMPAEPVCSNCKQRPVGNTLKKCGFADWCSECDAALWATNPDADNDDDDDVDDGKAAADVSVDDDDDDDHDDAEPAVVPAKRMRNIMTAAAEDDTVLDG